VPEHFLTSDDRDDAYSHRSMISKHIEEYYSDYRLTLLPWEDDSPVDYFDFVVKAITIYRHYHHMSLLDESRFNESFAWNNSTGRLGHHNTRQAVQSCHKKRVHMYKYPREGACESSTILRQHDGNPADTGVAGSAIALEKVHQLLAGNILGRKQLHIWKCSAGRSKSWRRFPRLRMQAYDQQAWRKWRRRKQSALEHTFAAPLVWLPSALLRSQSVGSLPRTERLPYRHFKDRRPKKHRCIRIDHAYEHDEGITHHQADETLPKGLTERLDSSGNRDDGTVPGNAFIRFIWKDKTLVNGVGQLDRLLPTGLLFRSGRRIVKLIRNDSHADVYSLSIDNIRHCEPEITSSLEAHVFLDEYHGNSQTFANRQKARMRRSGHCLDIFWYEGRHVFINKIRRERQLFKLRNNEEEFPSLVSQKKCMKHIALQRRSFRGMPSFAAIVKYSPLQAVNSTSSTTWVYGALVRAYERHKKEVGQRINEVLVAQRMGEALMKQRAYALLIAQKMNGVLASQSRNEILLAWKSLHQAELESIQKEREMIAAMLTQTHERLEERLTQVAGVLTERIEVEAYYMKDTSAKVKKELA
jgi:hypothetical protein